MAQLYQNNTEVRAMKTQHYITDNIVWTIILIASVLLIMGVGYFFGWQMTNAKAEERITAMSNRLWRKINDLECTPYYDPAPYDIGIENELETRDDGE